MRVAIGSDHAGFALKERVKAELLRLGHEVQDLGTDSADKSVDYPDFAIPVAERVATAEPTASRKGFFLAAAGTDA